jgi:hypothetical protein
MLRPLRPTLIGLLAWTALAWGQRPADADAAALIERSRQKALDYARSLPDFVCTETVRRYTARDSRQPLPWTSTDKLTVKLSFFQQKEDHKLMLVNDRPTDRKYEGLEGVTGAGEFGGTLLNIFEPAAQASFRWQSWKNVRRHRAAEYTYVVEAAHSRFLLRHGAVGHPQEAIVGFHGDLEVEGTTGEVLDFTYVADDIPRNLSLSYAGTTVDYDFAAVGGRDYLLPARSETEMRSANLWLRNNVEFREYRKFSADSVVEFGAAK